jgi:hypothetical protein
MNKRIATLASLFCMVAAGCSGGTPTGASVPDRPLYDGGVGMIGGGRSAGIGPGGRTATDSSTVNTTDTATCSDERGGGWVGPGGRVVNPCETTALGQ